MSKHIFMMPVANKLFLGRYRRNRRKEYVGFKADSVIMGLLSVVCIALCLLVYDWIYSKIFPNVLQFENMEGLKRNVNIFVRGLVIGSIFYFIARHIFMIKDQQKHQLEIEKLKRAQLEANLSSLKEQISPHFLFNTLNTLSTLTTDKTIKAYVAQLANVYRYVLENKTHNTTTLSS